MKRKVVKLPQNNLIDVRTGVTLVLYNTFVCPRSIAGNLGKTQFHSI